MIKTIPTGFLILGLIFFFIISPNDSEAIILEKNLGVVNELVVSSNNTAYFFERDMNVKSPFWIPDTKIVSINENGIHLITEELFIFPTELIDFENNLIFAILPQSCIGQVTCDYQNIIKMSKSTGEYSIIGRDFKSAIHITTLNNSVVVSESNGKIWEITLDGSIKNLLYEGKNIIMDITSNDRFVYWIEEIEDQNNSIFYLDSFEQKNPEIIATNQKIPYSLGIEGNTLHWNEIFVKASDGRVAEFTAIHAIQQNDLTSNTKEFENTSPLSKDSVSYGPYQVYENFLFLVNNTKPMNTVHLIDITNKTANYDIGKISGYDARFMRNDQNNLYLVGENDDGFVIEYFILPVTIPEFSLSYIPLIIATSLGLTIFFGRSFRY